jgi:putative ABC transport system permease protein
MDGPVAHAGVAPAFRRGAPALIAFEVTLTVMLTIGALLLVRSFSNLARVDPGYVAAGVLTFELSPADDPFTGDVAAATARHVAAADALIARVRTLPGVSAAAFTSGLPMVEGSYMVSIGSAPGAPATPIDQGRGLVVSPDYFTVMRMRIVAGRGFTSEDEGRSSATFVVNQTLGRRYFGAANPIGRRIYLWGIPGDVVGVVEDTHATTLDVAAQPQIFMGPFRGQPFLPLLSDGLYFTLRASNPAALVPLLRTAAREVVPDAAVQRVAMMDQIVANSISMNRAYAVIVGTLAAGALLLVSIGLYGVIAYLVNLRAREIAIRVAIGAPRRTVLQLVVQDGLAGVAIGALGGIAAAWVTVPALRGMLFGVGEFDPGTFVLTPLLVLGIAICASGASARRALTIQPMSVLRAE